MTLKLTNTPAGVVIREISASGECAYRVTPLGEWHYCGDHKGPWLCISADKVPARVRDALAKFDTANGLAVA
jgi:hypothetical protein